MDLNIKTQVFLVTGVTSGFGKATAEYLLNEGAKVIGVARTKDTILRMGQQYSTQFIGIVGDITDIEIVNMVAKTAIEHDICGAFINAGGPPAKRFEETTLEEWDNAYYTLLKWKVALTQQILPHLRSKRYGRILFLESSSVKQPIDNLVLIPFIYYNEPYTGLYI